MAIDTLAKRAAALTFGHPGLVLPPPAGTIGTLARATLLGCYDLGSAPAPTTTGQGILFRNTVSRDLTFRPRVSRSLTYSKRSRQ